VPSGPGVYIFKGTGEKVLYVGKAKNLRNRLRSYFRKAADLDQRKKKMVELIRDFSYIAVSNELEAFILEASLIKQFKPGFNIILRDDKNYPYIKLTVKEQWPRMEVVRRIARDGNLYFGPYVPAQSMREALAVIRSNFFIRSCGFPLDKPMRPCIRHQMKRCPGPCAGLISRDDYMQIVQDIRLFLSGGKRELMERLEADMARLSDDMRYEEAAVLRDRIFMLRRAFESQKVIAPELGDLDVIGHLFEGPEDGAEPSNWSFNVLFVRNGVLIGSKDFYLNNIMEPGAAEVIHGFMEFFYSKDSAPPPLILVGKKPADAAALVSWLTSKRGETVSVRVPARGKKRGLLAMADENAALHFHLRKKGPDSETPSDLRDMLRLNRTPESIGAFDVSTIQGSDSVGAFVWWEHGDFDKDCYRRFRIKGVQGVDDFAMMREIVQRTLVGLKRRDTLQDIRIPDMIIVDGGKGQLEVGRRVLEEYGIKADIIGVAKKPDRAFLTTGEVIALEGGSGPVLLLRRIRDEVHRFAISYHRKLRDKHLLESPLEKIEGVGKKRRLQLLRHFGSLEGIRKATEEEIMEIKGMDKKTAQRIVKTLAERR